MRLPELSLGRLGFALIVLTAGGWLTGAPYLLYRLGLLPSFPAPALDGPHVALGVALAVLVGLKVYQVRVRLGASRLEGVLAWQRWLSVGLLATYGGVLVSGAALALPFPAPVRSALVDLHLLTAVWAGLATVVHVLKHVRGRFPRALLDRRFAAGAALLVLPAALVAAVPAALSPLAQAGASSSWRPVGPRAAVVTRLVRLPGGVLAAAGTGLWLSRDSGASWAPVPDLRDELVRSVAASGSSFYAAGEFGVLVAGRPEGPYLQTPLRQPVDSLFAAPDGRLWAGGQGLWTSADGGQSWTPAIGGLVPTGHVWTFAGFEGSIYAGATTGVYRWNGAAWDRVSTLASVYSLDPAPGGELWASSMGAGLEVLRDGRWQSSEAGLAPHSHGGSRAIHVDGFTPLGSGRALAATMDLGVASSSDGGRTWSDLSPNFRPGDVWQLLVVGNRVLAATDTGIYSKALVPAPPPGAPWWLLSLAAPALTALAAAWFALPARSPRASRAATEGSPRQAGGALRPLPAAAPAALPAGAPPARP